MSDQIGRREFLRLSAVTAAGVAVAACQPQTVIIKETVEVEKQVEKVVKETVVVEKEVQVEKEVTKVVEKEVTKVVEKVVVATPEPAMFKEAPMLADLVGQGKLPPLEQRLPKDTLTVLVEDSIGRYGGKVNAPHKWFFYFELSLLQKLHDDRDTWRPMVAKSWAWADDYTTITFYLHEGQKWSDGAPYTVDDILFWWNDFIQSKYNTKPRTAGMNAKTDKLIKIDDYAFRLEFYDEDGNPKSRPLFLDQSRGGYSYGWYGYPRQYFEALHPDYNETAQDRRQEEFDKLMQGPMRWNQWVSTVPEAPTLAAWHPVEYQEAQYALHERNPYYFGLDPEGNQMPYIDQIESLDKSDSDAEMIKVKLLSGEADGAFRVVGLRDYPLFKENEEKSGLQVILLDDIRNGRQVFHFNQDYVAEDAIGDLLRNVDFRRAMSLALNRPLINQSLFLGLAKLGHGFSEQGVFDEAIDGSYATYDPDMANELLNDLGLDGRDADGYRTLPDGTQLTLSLMFRSGWGYAADDVAEIADESWRAVGLRVAARPADGRVYGERISGNDWHIKQVPTCGGWTGFFLQTLGTGMFAGEGYAWVASNGEEGIRPDDVVSEYIDLEMTALETADEARLGAVYQDMRRMLAENLWMIGSICNANNILVVDAKLRNVPGQTGPAYIDQGESEYLRNEQWYFAE